VALRAWMAGLAVLAGLAVPLAAFTNAVQLCTETTDDQGKATCKASREHDEETCYTAAFAGDDTYEPSTATVCKRHDDDKPDPWSALLDQSDVHIQALLPTML
jgi:hypothetical protein